MGYLNPDLEGIDHRDDTLTVLKMVKNRLIWVRDTEKNDEIISGFIYEAMAELELCFRVRFYTDEKGRRKEDWDRVGQEQFYHTLMRSILADIVCIYILTMLATSLSTGKFDDDSESTAPSGLFLKSAKAGTVDVAWEQIKVDAGSAVLAFDSMELLTLYRNNAIRKAVNLGCVIDILEDNAVKILELTTDMTKVKSFTIAPWTNIGDMRISREFDIKDFQ